MKTRTKIITTDCTIALPRMQEGSIDCIVTSPPYNIGVGYNMHDDCMSEEDYLKWLDEVFSGIAFVMKQDGHFWLNMGCINRVPDIGFRVMQVAQKHFVLQNHFIWVKSIVVNGVPMGNLKPINSNRYVTPTWEHLFHFSKTENATLNRLAIGVPHADPGSNDRYKRARGRIVKRMGYFNWPDFQKNASEMQMRDLLDELSNKGLTETTKSGNVRCIGNTWFIPYEPINDSKIKGHHPATYPVKLAENCIRISNLPQNAIILDPFIGTGTTAIAALNCGLNCIGFEIDETYAMFAEERIAQWQK